MFVVFVIINVIFLLFSSFIFYWKQYIISTTVPEMLNEFARSSDTKRLQTIFHTDPVGKSGSVRENWNT